MTLDFILKVFCFVVVFFSKLNVPQFSPWSFVLLTHVVSGADS